eukprot:TRINITY_DN47640_c0_g2_i1.p1 TRINITY_DN47640_c0_g2~~TRINITY_DN47640_c0_g2_i1.p1  ORF type:complete len:163 (-),score=8.29 TRINITY_DN47640_c0_g2_i1:30-518(-)
MSEQQKNRALERERKKQRQRDRHAAAEKDRENSERALLPIIQENFGYSKVQSDCCSCTPFTEVSELTEALAGETVTIRGRIHAKRISGRLGFVVLRGLSCTTVQCVLIGNDDERKAAVHWMKKWITTESIVDVTGLVKTTDVPITQPVVHKVTWKSKSAACS